jgi:hypothetical protein
MLGKMLQVTDNEEWNGQDVPTTKFIQKYGPNPYDKRPLGWPKDRWEVNIKLVEDKAQWQDNVMPGYTEPAGYSYETYDLTQVPYT